MSMFVMRYETRPRWTFRGLRAWLARKMACHYTNLAVVSLSAQLFQYRVELFQVPVFYFQGAPLAVVIDAYLEP